MAETPDLPSYFDRIGYAGSRAPTLQTLRAIHLHHAQAIPFENLDPLLRRPVRLDLPSLERKLLHERRGGYCFEQNLLLTHVLRQLGFRLTCLAARVLWNVPEGTTRPRGHMLVCIDLEDEPYIADVGFGGLTLTAPLRLVPDIVQATPHESFRLIEAGAEFVLQARLGGVWRALYRFDLQPQIEADYEVSSWYLSNHPQSYFVNSLLVGRPAAGRRYGLFNNQLSVHTLQGETEQRTVTTGAELRRVLENEFGLRLPPEPALDAVLAGLAVGTVRE